MTNQTDVQPLELTELAKDLNNFDTLYQYSDDHSVWKYWSDRSKKLREKLQSLNQQSLAIVKQLTKKEKQEFFSI